MRVHPRHPMESPATHNIRNVPPKAHLCRIRHSPKIFPQHFHSNTRNLLKSYFLTLHVPHPYSTTGRISALHNRILNCLESGLMALIYSVVTTISWFDSCTVSIPHDASSVNTALRCPQLVMTVVVYHHLLDCGSVKHTRSPPYSQAGRTCSTWSPVPVSYTHLDVYKRQ